MSNTNTPMVQASIDQTSGYPEETTKAFLREIQEPDLVNKYLGRFELDLDYIL